MDPHSNTFCPFRGISHFSLSLIRGAKSKEQRATKAMDKFLKHMPILMIGSAIASH
jgi:hypothetical protein